MLTSRDTSILAAALIGALAWPAVIGAQTTTTTQVAVETPSGWFGVTISDEAKLDERGNAFFDSYPVVTTVERGSPAARAGVVPGDVLVSFNSHDMRGGSLQMRKWLRPGAPFVLRLRRNDAVRVVRGTLGKPPANWEKRVVVELSMPERMEMRTMTPAREPTASAGVTRVRMPAPPPSSVLLPALGYGGGVYPFAGAEFTALNDDLSELLGVKEGVFVTNVAEGSPARISGLRGGDVILKADSIKVDTPIDLVRAIRAARPDNTVSLQIIRKHKPQTLVLRW
ncbi:MAG TPA: PDZ domain-containing protein [Gemmatimonadaceae bacterium]|nr:PDZ domain-containing protein [Gemmatimonadaceae bacterium]